MNLACLVNFLFVVKGKCFWKIDNVFHFVKKILLSCLFPTMQQSMVASIIYSPFETKMMLLRFQIHHEFLPHKFGIIFKHQMQVESGSNVTESLSLIIGDVEELRFGGG